MNFTFEGFIQTLDSDAETTDIHARDDFGRTLDIHIDWPPAAHISTIGDPSEPATILTADIRQARIQVRYRYDV